MILAGFVCMATAMVLFMNVETTWQLIYPAIAGGLGHSLLFPSVIAAGSVGFPQENRGTATSLILGAYDIGILVGSPLLGLILVRTRAINLPDYPIMFGTIGLTIVGVCVGVFCLYAHDDGSRLKRRGVPGKTKPIPSDG